MNYINLVSVKNEVYRKTARNIEPMKTTIIRVIKWGIIISTIGVILFFSSILFYRDCRIYSEERVQINIQKNYFDKKEKFDLLINFLQDLELNLLLEIDFTNRNELYGSISSDLKSRKGVWDCSASCLYSGEEFNLREDGIAEYSFSDTIIQVSDWSWTFMGDENECRFQRFLKYAQLSEEDLNLLETLVENADCEAISLHKNGNISLKYDGINGYQYQYYIPGEKGKSFYNYTFLDDGIYFGLHDDGLFCGYVIFDK